jgi:hypothetical protein
MADAVTTQVLVQSKSDYEIVLTNKSDGTGESAVTKVDVSALSPACDEVALVDCEFVTGGMAVELWWDATADTPMLFLPPDQYGKICFKDSYRGVLRNNAGAGKTGDVQLTTVGHTAGDTYWIKLRFRKLLTAEL